MSSPKPELPSTSGRLDSQLRQARIRASLFQKSRVSLKIGRFALLERVGAGSMGEVYAAYDDRLDRKVAIKLVRGDFEGSDHANERLLREAKILARLSHPNVVQIYDVGLFEGRVFIAMEFIRGRTMTRWLETVTQERERARTPRILRHFVAAGRGLEAGHRAGLTHRDFKPDNILVSDEGRVVVVDFGLARLEGVEPGAGAEPTPEDLAAPRQLLSTITTTTTASVSALTPRGTALGTPAYMAPEVYAGSRDYFERAVAMRQRGGAAAGRTELIYAAQNLAMVTEDAPRREALMASVARELAEILGSSHPQAMRQLVHYASYIANPWRADETLEPACQAYREGGQPEVVDGMLRCLYLSALLHAEMDETERAAAVIEELVERIPADTDGYRVLRLIARGYALLYRERYAEALAVFADARAALPEAPVEWWTNKDIGDTQLGMGVAHLMLSQYDEASADLERSPSHDSTSRVDCATDDGS